MALGGCGGASDARHDGAPPSTVAERTPSIDEMRATMHTAIVACKRGVDTARWLSESNKEDLYRTCASGVNNYYDERQAVKLACKEVAYVSPSPSAAAKARAFNECYAEVKPWVTASQKPRT